MVELIHQIGTWCNGNTTDFDFVDDGSNPSAPVGSPLAMESVWDNAHHDLYRKARMRRKLKKFREKADRTFADVVELADTMDLKSIERKFVSVQIRLSALKRGDD